MNATPFNSLVEGKSGCVLVVSPSEEMHSHIEKTLAKVGVSTVLAKTEEQTLDILQSKIISYVFIDAGLSGEPRSEFIRMLRNISDDKYIPIILLVSTKDEDEDTLACYISAGCDEILYKPFSSLALKSKISSLEKMRKLNQLYKDSVNEQILAKHLLMSAIDERSIYFKDISFLSRSKAIFSGDLFITARHPDGSLNILLADFTGHGLSAAIGALPVADVFSVMTNKGFDLAFILENINRKLYTLLPTNMFMACSALTLSSDLKRADVWNGGMPDVFVRGGETGEIQHRIQSSHIPLGITEQIINQYELQTVDIGHGDQFILFSDGLTEALNKSDDMFGEQRLEDCLKGNTSDKTIFMSLVNAFNEFCGDVNPLDDVTLACVPCTDKLMNASDLSITKKRLGTYKSDNSWGWYLELGGASLQKINPVPMVIEEIQKMTGHSVSANKLSRIMSILYENVIGDNLSASHSSNPSEDDSDVYIKIGIKEVDHNGFPALLVQMEDSGRVVAHTELLSSLNIDKEKYMDALSEDLPLVYELNKFEDKEAGNRLEAIICSRV